MMSNVMSAALEYASRGLRVLPCGSAKNPITPRGVYSASADPDTIRRWFANRDCNVGIACGPESGILVIDVDARSNGWQTLADLAFAYEPLEVSGCAHARSGGGGGHFVFRYPELAENEFIRGKLGPGIDVIAAGKFFVAEPSVHLSGNKYRWLNLTRLSKTDAPQMPAWLRTMVVAEFDTPLANPEASSGLDMATDVTSAQLWLRKCPPAISGNGGSSHTLKTAMLLMSKFALSNAMTIHLMADWNRSNEPPWSAPGLERKVLEARKLVNRR